MPIGRQCVSHYRDLSRYCVFSHDEMVCNIAAKVDEMDVELVATVQKEMDIMVDEEEVLRKKITKMVTSSYKYLCFFFVFFINLFSSIQWMSRVQQFRIQGSFSISAHTTDIQEVQCKMLFSYALICGESLAQNTFD